MRHILTWKDDFSLFLAQKLYSNQPHLSKDQKDVVLYGIKIVVYNLAKLIPLFLIAVALGYTREFLEFLISFAIIRAVVSGKHSSNSLVCTLQTFVGFGGAIVISILFTIPIAVKVLIGFMCAALFVLFSPLPTAKRRVIRNSKVLKIISVICAVGYTALSVLWTPSFLADALISALFISGISVIPEGKGGYRK